MENRIITRHGSGVPDDSKLLPYELGWNGNVLYINNNGTVVGIGEVQVSNGLPESSSNALIYIDTSTGYYTPKFFYGGAWHNFGEPVT